MEAAQFYSAHFKNIYRRTIRALDSAYHFALGSYPERGLEDGFVALSARLSCSAYGPHRLRERRDSGTMAKAIYVTFQIKLEHWEMNVLSDPLSPMQKGRRRVHRVCGRTSVISE
jgi:hypothetical protein